MIGKIRLDVLHTPGHTPESVSFLLTDLGGSADKPMGIFTGDFVFVGSIGRPDLLEGNRSRPVEEFRGWLLVEAGFDGGAEPLVDRPLLQAAGF